MVEFSHTLAPKMTHSNLALDGDLLRLKLKEPFDLMALYSKTQNWLGMRDSTLLRNRSPMVEWLRAAERHWRSRSNPNQPK